MNLFRDQDDDQQFITFLMTNYDVPSTLKMCKILFEAQEFDQVK